MEQNVQNTAAKKKVNVRRLTALAMLSAISFVVLLLSKQIPLAAPGAPFLNFDMKDTMLIIGGLMYGPTAGILISAVVCFIEMITISSTGLYGFIMNLLATCMMVVPAGMCYQRSHTLKGAVLGLVIGVVLMTASMLLWNYAITPYYMGVPREAVAEMLLPIFLPFNVLKGALNAALTMVLYKPIGMALRRARLVEQPTETTKKSAFKAGTLFFSLGALVTVVLLVLVYTGVL